MAGYWVTSLDLNYWAPGNNCRAGHQWLWLDGWMGSVTMAGAQEIKGLAWLGPGQSENRDRGWGHEILNTMAHSPQWLCPHKYGIPWLGPNQIHGWLGNDHNELSPLSTMIELKCGRSKCFFCGQGAKDRIVGLLGIKMITCAKDRTVGCWLTK